MAPCKLLYFFIKVWYGKSRFHIAMKGQKMFSHIKTIAVLLIVLTACSASTAFARNEVVNGVFKNGRELSTPIQGDRGVAKWMMTRPDNGQSMYFEWCWGKPGSWKCKYEVLFNGRTSPPDDDQATSKQTNGSAVDNDDFAGWSGTFDVKKNGDVFIAMKNGKPMGTFGNCKNGDGHAGKGWYCEDASFISK